MNDKDRRIHQRIPLDAPYFTELLFTDQSSAQVMVVDISAGGVQITFPPEAADVNSLLGQHVYVQHLPGEPNGVDGIVAWVSRQHCGIRFTSVVPLDLDDLYSVTSSASVSQ